MSRAWPVLAVLVALASGPARADDDEPKLRGKTLAQWIAHLHKDKESKDRQRAVVAVEILSDKQARPAASALTKALNDDKSEDVRESAALALGRVVAKAFAQARAEKKDD